MPGKGSGGGTSFEDMSHEQMLAWLDQADPGTVQAAADRLTAAAKEIRKIAEELKIRPQWVEWKGEGAHAFRTWSGDLANSTLRLGDFSEGAGKWLNEASGAIAQAQASIPRDTKGATADMDAANAAHNDPDAAAVSAKAKSEPAALAAHKERVRLEAAAQMRKLGQTYEWSATQMNRLERPKFPPPPASIVPRDVDGRSTDLARPSAASSGRPSGGGAGAAAIGVTHGHAVTSGQAEARPSTSAVSPHRLDHPSSRPPASEPATHVGIDSAGVLPEVHHPSTDSPTGAPATPRPNTEAPPLSNGTPPPPIGVPARMPSVPGGLGREAVGGRMPAQPEQGAGRPVPGRGPMGPGAAPGLNLPSPEATPSGRAVPGQDLTPGRGASTSPGVTGGRPAATSATGRRAGRWPGGTVVGGEPSASRSSTGGGPTAAPREQERNPSSSAAGRSMTTPRNGITGGRLLQAGRTPARPGAPIPSAPMREGISGGMPSQAGTQRGARGAAAGPTGGVRQRQQKQQTDRRGEEPTEDR
ncbi:translation initiation factor IF-2 [Streptomyces sp. BK340]|uniref:translation initiation factor IF-2 n=1 Tax=Streptomyces sp. BK340 TaxID=2572903 RepID=UPI00119F5FE5|nr:translation initiation factor IF-2 [Streptomyces sp. BK340]TVZ75921.1 hypothetical protein FB157_1482 [Streptomyces sp. BK340]